MFRALKTYFGCVLKDSWDAPSSKRLVMIMGGLCLFCGFWAGLLWHLAAPDNIVEAIKWITGGAAGGVAAEPIAKALTKPKVND